MKEEILQPPEPQPVPPILTPSPPSAFPTVTNVRQDNDRYHPKPVIHVLATTQSQVSLAASPPTPPRLSERRVPHSGSLPICFRSKRWTHSRTNQKRVQTKRRSPRSRKTKIKARSNRLRSPIWTSTTTTTTSCPRRSRNPAKATPPPRRCLRASKAPAPLGSRGS